MTLDPALDPLQGGELEPGENGILFSISPLDPSNILLALSALSRSTMPL